MWVPCARERLSRPGVRRVEGRADGAERAFTAAAVGTLFGPRCWLRVGSLAARERGCRADARPGDDQATATPTEPLAGTERAERGAWMRRSDGRPTGTPAGGSGGARNGRRAGSAVP